MKIRGYTAQPSARRPDGIQIGETSRRIAILATALAVTALLLSCSGSNPVGPTNPGWKLSAAKASVNITSVRLAAEPPDPVAIDIWNDTEDTLDCRFNVHSGWVSVDLGTCCLLPGDSNVVTLTLDTDTLLPGEYTDTLVINEPGSVRSLRRIPINLKQLVNTTKLLVRSTGPANWTPSGQSYCPVGFQGYRVDLDWENTCESNGGNSIIVKMYTVSMGFQEVERPQNVVIGPDQTKAGHVTVSPCLRINGSPNTDLTVAITYEALGKERYAYVKF